MNISLSGILSISFLSLVAALKDCSMAGGASPKFKTFLIIFTLPKICSSEFGAKNYQSIGY